jgi:hypothetical protein
MGVGHEISPEGALYASSMAIEEGCLTAGNVFALILVGMAVIGHLHFFLFAVCVEAIGCPLGVLGSRGILSWALYGSCWLPIPQKGRLWNRLTRSSLSQSSACFAFRTY